MQAGIDHSYLANYRCISLCSSLPLFLPFSTLSLFLSAILLSLYYHSLISLCFPSILFSPLSLPLFLLRGSTANEATQNVINQQIPAIVSLCDSGDVHVDNIDVFCEKGVFDTDQSRRILLAGKEAGWKINFHGDEIHPMNSGEVSPLNSLAASYHGNIYISVSR